MPRVETQQLTYADTLTRLSREFRALAGSNPAATHFATYADTLDDIVFDLLVTDADPGDA